MSVVDVPMSLKEARTLVQEEPDFWTAFSEMPDFYLFPLTRTRYETAATRFIYYTHDAYVGGASTRCEAVEKFVAWVCENHGHSVTNAEHLACMIFESIDAVHAYT